MVIIHASTILDCSEERYKKMMFMIHHVKNIF